MASASSIKQILLEWCRSKTLGYQVSPGSPPAAGTPSQRPDQALPLSLFSRLDRNLLRLGLRGRNHGNYAFRVGA